MNIIPLNSKGRKEVEALRVAHAAVISTYESRNSQAAKLGQRRERLEKLIGRLETSADPDDRKKIQQLAEAKVELDLVTKRIGTMSDDAEPLDELNTLLATAKDVLPRVLQPTEKRELDRVFNAIRPHVENDDSAKYFLNQLPGIGHMKRWQTGWPLNQSLSSIKLARAILNRCQEILVGEIPGDFDPKLKKAAK